MKYNDSPYLMLKTLYPDYDWLPWKFTRAPTNFWDDIKMQRKYMDWLFTQLHLKDMNDWYKLSSKVINPLQNHLLNLILGSF